ncbi:hypothetical protein AB0L63_27020 [Nocardia sp. NPDC051990]|uniref:hypothetical protein n=1 Tax=Nocardia sp. NPDC051990 TaxID=3155285 RepID=UPI0034264AFF
MTVSTRLLAGVAQVLTVAMIGTNMALAGGGVITTGTAVGLWLAVELPLFAITVALFGWRVRVAVRRDDVSVGDAVHAALSESPIYRFARSEFGAYRSVWMWIRGKTDPDRGLVFTASAGVLTMPAAFGAATLIEVVVLHLVLPWFWLKIVLAVISLWSLVLLAAFVANDVVHPHYLSQGVLVLRRSGKVVVKVPVSHVSRVVSIRRYSRTQPEIEGSRLYLPNHEGTNIELALNQRSAAAVPAFLEKWRSSGAVTTIFLYVDEPSKLADAVRGTQQTDVQATSNKQKLDAHQPGSSAPI